MPANFKPEMSVIKDLKPFKFWCSKVLPTVYDDSLSYYELLTKVLRYLNETMESVETLDSNVNNIYDAYVLLEDYVNNYFDSQDFQTMVNNKLDEMAENGVLDALLEPIANNYLDEKTAEINTKFSEQNELIQLQNANIDSIESQMAEFVKDHAGPVEMVTLFEGYADAQGTEIVLSDTPTNYDFIDVYYATGGLEYCPNIFRFPAEKFHISTGVRVNVSHGENDRIDPRLSVYSMRIIPADSVNDQLYTVTQSSHWLWDGVATDDAINYANNLTDENKEAPAVLKIVGVRNSQNDAEIINARIGYDGHVYNTVGEAIRDQISDLYERFATNINEAVQTWLDEHPEATTTVEDGSITVNKLDTSVLNLTDNHYVTPQMFGAVGDGVTDDSYAISTMLASDNNVFAFPPATYYIGSDINFNKADALFIGFGRFNSVIQMGEGVTCTVSQPRVEFNNIGFKGGNGVVTSSNRISFISCTFEDSDTGIKMNNGYINRMLNCSVLHNRIGVDLNDSSYETIIQNCVIDQNRGIGIYVHGTVTGAIIKNNTIEGNQDSSGNGFGILIYCNYASLTIDSNWFELNGNNSSVISADILTLGSYYTSDISDVINFAKTLITYVSAWNNRGKIVITNNNFVYTKYGAITAGDNTKYIITGNAFRGVLNLNNKPIVIASRFLYSNVYEISSNTVHNPANANIDTEMLTGVNGTYVYTTLTYNSDHYLEIQNKIKYDGNPLYLEGNYTVDAGYVRIGNIVVINYTHTVTADDATNNYITPTVTFPTRVASYENIPLLVSRQGSNDYLTGFGVFNRNNQFALTGELQRGNSNINSGPTTLTANTVLRFHGIYICQ